MSKLLFKFPTRERPALFTRTLIRYYEYLSRKHPFQFLITVDKNDHSMYGTLDYLDTQENLMYCCGESSCKVEAINANIHCADPDWDILVLLSDDMLPVERGFDDIIVTSMLEKFPDLNGAIWFDDGRNSGLATMAIMGRPLYEEFGYIYNPEYKSLWCDNEYQSVLEARGQLAHIPKTIIKHSWIDITGKDSLHCRNEDHYGPDSRTYYRRKELGFPKPIISE